MNAIDTNVLVRFLTDDDADQAARARRLFESGPIHLPLTVLLETFWVLHKSKGMPSSLVLARLLAVTRLATVSVEDAQRFDRAIALTDAGMDFADALHLTATDSQMGFATFDLGMIRAARRAGVGRVFAP